MAQALGAGAMFAVPIVSSERAWGLLLVFLWRPPLFAADDLELLILFAEQKAISLSNANLLAEQRSLIAELRLSEERNRLIIDQALDAAISIDADGIVTGWNPQAERIFGWSRAAVIGRPVAETIIPLRYRELHRSGLQRFLSTGEAQILNQTIQIEALHSDGHEFPIELAVWPVKLGERFTFSAFARDISARKRAESDLRTSEEKFSKAFRASPTGMALTGLADGRILEVNDRYLQITGYRRDEALGHTTIELELITPERREQVTQLLGEHGFARDLELTVTTKCGDLRDVLFSSEQVELESQPAILTILYDVTESKQAEAAIRQLNADLAKQATQLETANKELEAFSYSVSHDLRAPLRAIDGFSRVLEEKYSAQLPPEGLRFLGLVRDNAKRMGQLIDDLLAFSRLGRMAMHAQPVDMSALVREVLADLSREQNGSPVDIVVGDLPPCLGDASLLNQVWMNLLSNALKFTSKRENPRIEIGVLPPPQRQANDAMGPVYFVRDNGAGFDMRYANKLFGVFQRLHRVSEFDGTGVGLAIVQRVIQRHGGRIWAEGAVGHGATFFFTLRGIDDGNRPG